jgi:hypothetical protein
VLIFLVLAAGFTWIARHTYWDYDTAATPLKGEAATNSFYTLEHLAHRLGIRTRQLSNLRTLPSPAGVLVVNDLHGGQLRDRLSALQEWVEEGGRLLVSREVVLSTPPLQTWSGITLGLRDPDQEPSRPPKSKSNGSHPDCPLLSERVKGAATGREYRACVGSSEFSLASRHLPVWSLSNEYGVQMLRVALGKGSLAVIDCDCVLGNKSLLRQDHARLVYAAVPLKAGDELAILNPKDPEGLLALLWHDGSAAILTGGAALALVIWRYLPRFGAIAPVPAPLRRSLAEQIRAKARFAWRTRKLASLRRVEIKVLESAGRRRVPSYDRLDAAQRIRLLSLNAGVDPAALSAALAEEFPGGAEAELAAVALLETARRNLDLQLTPSHGARP